MTSLAQRTPPSFHERAAVAGVEVGLPARLGPLLVDLDRYAVSLDGQALELSPRQVELLALFLAASTRVWSQSSAPAVLGRHGGLPGQPSRRVDVQLCRLRAKTGLDLFRNVRERGWALRTPDRLTTG